VTRHIVPDEVLSREERLAEAKPLARLPATPFAFIWYLVRTHFPKRVAILVALAATATAVDAFGPLALSHLINAIGHAFAKHLIFKAAVLPWVLVMAAIWLISASVYRGYEAIDIEVSPRMRALAQKYLFVYMLGHSPRYFQENFAGKLGQKIKQSGQATVSILNILCLDMVRVTGLVIVGGVLMFEAHASYALILGGWTILYLGIVISLAQRCVRLSKALSDEVSTSTGRLVDAITVGAFAMIYFLGNQIARSVQELSFRMLDYFEQLGTLTEALELVTSAHEIVDAPDARPLVVRDGAIRFERICFAHPDGQSVFQDLSLDIRTGEKVGLVGPSGAGKSTLVKLLRRQYEPQGGRILIDGVDIAHVTWDSLNEAIAEVPQVPGVFHRAVRDNIRYARPDAREEDVMRAAIDAYAHAFIEARPTGYGTIVGEQGIKLSGGERQRVAIARALVKAAKILVLDEATSSLDSESEHLIQQGLWTLMQGRTVIAIAHRLSTIAGMDRIVYLEAGRIIEDGPHRELLARGGAYARLWNRQMGGFIDAA